MGRFCAQKQQGGLPIRCVAWQHPSPTTHRAEAATAPRCGAQQASLSAPTGCIFTSVLPGKGHPTRKRVLFWTHTVKPLSNPSQPGAASPPSPQGLAPPGLPLPACTAPPAPPPSGARRFRRRVSGSGGRADMADPPQAAEAEAGTGAKQKEKQKNRNKKKAAAGGGGVRVCAGLAAGSPGSSRGWGFPPWPRACCPVPAPGAPPVSSDNLGLRSLAAIPCRRRGSVGKAGCLPACGAGVGQGRLLGARGAQRWGLLVRPSSRCSGCSPQPGMSCSRVIAYPQRLPQLWIFFLIFFF